MAESFEKRLADIESALAESRDDNDPIRLSEITERIQEVAHSLEIMSNQMQGLHNQTKAIKRLLLAIGLAVGVILAGSLYAN